MAAKTQQRPALPEWFEVGDVSKGWRVNDSKILGFIHTGELVAVNVATKPGGTPRWRISSDALAAFTAARAAVPQAPVTRRPRRKSGDVVEYF